MKRIIATIITAAALATVVLATATAGAQPTTSGTTCGYLLDMNSGAASLVPKAKLYVGEGFWQESTGAWRLCQEPNGLVCLKSNTNWCMADRSGAIKLEHAALVPSQTWTRKNQASGGFRLVSNNKTRRYLCALGGVGTSDIGAPKLSECPKGANYDTWFWNGTP